MSRYADMSDDTVLHMEPDKYIEGNMLYNTHTALKSTDGTSTSVIAGGLKMAYEEGRGEDAKFTFMNRFLQVNSVCVIVIDSFNHVLRLINRNTRETHLIAGTPKKEYNPSSKENHQLLNYPIDIVDDRWDGNGYFITDLLGYRVRHFNNSTNKLTTVLIYKTPLLAMTWTNNELLVTSVNGLLFMKSKRSYTEHTFPMFKSLQIFDIAFVIAKGNANVFFAVDFAERSLLVLNSYLNYTLWRMVCPGKVLNTVTLIKITNQSKCDDFAVTSLLLRQDAVYLSVDKKGIFTIPSKYISDFKNPKVYLTCRSESTYHALVVCEKVFISWKFLLYNMC